MIPLKLRDRTQNAFTLIEILVVIAIISVIGAIAADIFVNVTRSYNKASIIADVERAGNTALSQMSLELRNARFMNTAVGQDYTSITFTNASGQLVTYSRPTPGAGQNGYVARNGNPITDNRTETGVDVTKLTFDVLGTSPTVVVIDISLNQPVGAPSRTDFQANIALTTSVSLRNY